jgi:hypothetical protein
MVDDDFMKALLDLIGREQIPHLEMVKAAIATVEDRTRISVKDYLGFGALT